MVHNIKDNDSQKGRQILESIVRALIKLIPVAGEAIDQVTFGSKDAIENAELKTIIQDIYKIVVEVNNRGLANISREAETILPEIIVEPNIQSILSKLDNLSQESFSELIELMIQIQINISKNDDFIKSFAESLQQIQGLQNQAIAEVQKTKSSQMHLENLLIGRLEKLEAMIEQLAQSKSPLPRYDLQTIYKELDDIEVSYLVDTSFNLVNVSNLIQSKYKIEWAVDFSELHGYARAPFSYVSNIRRPPDLYAGFRIFLFKRLDQPLYILPPTTIEINKYLERIRLNFMDRLDALQVRFLRRLRELPYGDKLKTWENHFVREYNFNSIPPFFEELRRFRPNPVSMMSNFIDAHVLALINEYNIRENNNLNRLGLITSSPTMLRIVYDRLRKKYPTICKGLYVSEQPLIINPYIYSALRYIMASEKRVNSLLSYSADLSSYTLNIKNKFGDIRSWLENPTVQSLGQVVFEVQNIRKSLVSIDEITHPFHDEVVSVQVEDYKNVPQENPTKSFKIVYEESLTKSLSVVSDLMSYFNPMDEAFKPFRDFRPETE